MGAGGGVQVVVWGLSWFTGERSSWEGVGGWRWWEAPDSQECQVTGLGPPPQIKIFIFKKKIKIKCCSVPLGLVGGVETAAGWEGEIVSTLFKGA